MRMGLVRKMETLNIFERLPSRQKRAREIPVHVLVADQLRGVGEGLEVEETCAHVSHQGRF